MSLSTLILRRLGVDAELAGHKHRLNLHCELTPLEHRVLRSDDRADALDAYAIARCIRDFSSNQPSQVLEHLLCGISSALLRRFPVSHVMIEAHKSARPDDPFELVVRIQLDRAALQELDRLSQRYED